MFLCWERGKERVPFFKPGTNLELVPFKQNEHERERELISNIFHI